MTQQEAFALSKLVGSLSDSTNPQTGQAADPSLRRRETAAAKLTDQELKQQLQSDCSSSLSGRPPSANKPCCYSKSKERLSEDRSLLSIKSLE